LYVAFKTLPSSDRATEAQAASASKVRVTVRVMACSLASPRLRMGMNPTGAIGTRGATPDRGDGSRKNAMSPKKFMIDAATGGPYLDGVRRPQTDAVGRVGYVPGRGIPHAEEADMMRIAGRFLALAIVFGAIAPAIAADRTADEILKEIDAIKPPKTFQEFQESAPKKAALITELYKVAPENARVPKLMADKWMTLANTGKSEEVAKDVDEVMANTKSEPLKIEAAYTKAMLAFRKNPINPEGAMPVVEEFMKLAPKDERGPSLLYAMVSRSKDEAKKAAVEDRILKDFPESQVATMLKGARRQKEGVGKPFDLEFTEAIKGTTIAMKDLKGKVVVVDFWATWCGPCIAEMPNMKKLYAEYKDKGVEFIGVSLDAPKEEGGLDALKKYVKDNDVQWLQYYQGKGWKSEFSASWGINGIPCVFIVDTNGNLYSTEARGKLETLIPELLKKGKGNAGAGGQ
jgi:thiol-disulfide isomerase/thioredoxin